METAACIALAISIIALIAAVCAMNIAMRAERIAESTDRWMRHNRMERQKNTDRLREALEGFVELADTLENEST